MTPAPQTHDFPIIVGIHNDIQRESRSRPLDLSPDTAVIAEEYHKTPITPRLSPL